MDDLFAVPSKGAFRGKTILVTGAAGFLGTNVLNALLASRAELWGTVHRKKPVLSDPRIHYVPADLTTARDCALAVNGMDYVIMCAASTGGAGLATRSPMAVTTPNVIMNVRMLEAAHAARVSKFLFVSSNGVYPADDRVMREEDVMSGPPFDKFFAAAWAKRFAEIMCEAYATKIADPMTTLVLRPANMYGPFDHFDFENSHMVPALLRKVIERHNPIEVWGDGTDVKDLIYVEDFVRELLVALERLEVYGPLNIATGIPVSVNDVLTTALRFEDYQPEIVYDTSKPVMIPKRLISIAKAERMLGFRAATTLADGIAKTIAWYKRTYPEGYK